VNRKLLSVLIVLNLFGWWAFLKPTIRSFAETIKVLKINSLTQHVVSSGVAAFEGEVELLVDNKFHVWAEKIVVNKMDKTIEASAKSPSAVSLETDDFLILADKIVLNVDKRVGYADNIRMHVDEGYISAGKAQKLNDSDWAMEDMLYTPCGAEKPHWHFKAQKAVVHGNYFIKGDWLVFKIGRMPVFGLPRMVFPIQGQSKSGFLIPKFAYDYEYGLGIKQEYYWYLSKHCDTTMGVNWVNRKGFVLSDEFRLARAADSYTLVNSWYGDTRNVYVQRSGRIFKKTLHRYGIEGKDFRAWKGIFLGGDVSSLGRIDVGSDKRIGYNFSNSIEDVDDSYYNSVALRSCWPKNLVEAKLEAVRVSRKQFENLTDDDKKQLEVLVESQPNNTLNVNSLNFNKKEIADNGTISYLPHFEWTSSYKIFKNLFAYRNDLFFDQISYRQSESEKFYINSVQANEDKIIPFRSADIARLGYSGTLEQSIRTQIGVGRVFVLPNFQFRSKLENESRFGKNVFERNCCGYGGYRAYMEYGSEWAFPELFFSNESGSCSNCFQPVASWEFLPKFIQTNWYQMDKWDRAYPKNEVALSLRNDIYLKDYFLNLQVTQPYDFYKQDDIFYLRRGVETNHLLPFKYTASLGKDSTQFTAAQEFEWGSLRMLQSMLSVGFKVDKCNVSCGYLFQNDKMQVNRALLSNIPHFWLMNLSVPVTKNTTVNYDGQFYCESRPHIFAFNTLKPLIHRLRLEYEGHCWGVSLGFEEKKYREYGNNRAERSWFLSFKLESLGSFSQKFKKPQYLTY